MCTKTSCLRGRVSYNTAQADCPPETGATEGVDKSLNSHPLTVKEQFSVFTFPFSVYFVPTGRHFIDSCNHSLPWEGEGWVCPLYPMLVYLPVQRIACDA